MANRAGVVQKRQALLPAEQPAAGNAGPSLHLELESGFELGGVDEAPEPPGRLRVPSERHARISMSNLGFEPLDRAVGSSPDEECDVAAIVRANAQPAGHPAGQ